MNTKLLIALASVVGTLTVAGPAAAQIAGSTTVAVSVTEMSEVARGWSAKKSILGKAVYNDAGAKVGNVADLIISPDKNLSYVIVGAGGFVGIARHDVAFPVAQIHEQDGKLVLANATKDSVKAMPEFEYATVSTAALSRDKLIAETDREIAKAKAEANNIEKKAAELKGEGKTQFDQQLASLHHDLKVAEDKLAEMKRASKKQWKKAETEVIDAMTHVRQSLAKASS